MHYDLAAESALAWHSFAYFSNWSEMVGGDCGFVRTGFLRIVPPDQQDALRHNVAAQREIGINTCLVGSDEVSDLVSGMYTGDFELAAYEPDSGYADPTTTCTSLLLAARASGAVVRHATQVEEIAVDGSRVIGVRTPAGMIFAPSVVLAAGAWSAPLAATAGVSLPIEAWHHDTGFVRWPAGDRPALPTVIDDIHALYFRPEGRELALVGLEDGNRIDNRAGDDSRSDSGFEAHLAERLPQRMAAFIDTELLTVHGGTDGITPDQRPLLGRHGPDGLVLQCGFSGTGFKTAPAVGLAVSELILDGSATSVDISIFDPGRFAAGRPIVPDHPYAALWR
jgi:sarcosine oxidase, subunit beta